MIRNKLMKTGAGTGLLVLATLTAGAAKPARHSAPTKVAKITAAQAEAVTLRRFPGKIVGKTTLENEEGKWQYGVMVESGHKLREVMVGAVSGRIEDVEVTTAAREGIEKKADARAGAARK